MHFTQIDFKSEKKNICGHINNFVTDNNISLSPVATTRALCFDMVHLWDCWFTCGLTLTLYEATVKTIYQTHTLLVVEAYVFRTRGHCVHSLRRRWNVAVSFSALAGDIEPVLLWKPLYCLRSLQVSLLCCSTISLSVTHTNITHIPLWRL